MKKYMTVLTALLATAALPALGGKRIQFEVTDLAKNTTTPREILLDADKIRINDGNNSIIFTTKGGNRLVILDKSRNEFYEMNPAQLESVTQQVVGTSAQVEAATKNLPPEQRAKMAQAVKSAASQAAPNSPSYASKGATTVNGFRCTHYDGTLSGQLVSQICAAQPADLKIGAQDFQVMNKLRDYFAGMANAAQSSGMANVVAGMATAPGVTGIPVRTVTLRSGTATRREELKSVTEATFGEADFSTGSAQTPGTMGAPKVLRRDKSK